MCRIIITPYILFEQKKKKRTRAIPMAEGTLWIFLFAAFEILKCILKNLEAF